MTWNLIFFSIQLQALFLKIKPDVTVSRIRPLIEKTVREFNKLLDADKPPFFNTLLDLDAITPDLRKIGITRSTAYSPPGLTSIEPVCVTNKIVIDFNQFINVERIATKEHMCAWLMHLLPNTDKRIVTNAIHRTISRCKKKTSIKTQTEE